jgi:hypothetical protein
VNWLKVVVVYYILIYLLLGRIAVDLFDLVTWGNMIGLFIGCCVGHYLGKIDAGGLQVGSGRSRKA